MKQKVNLHVRAGKEVDMCVAQVDLGGWQDRWDVEVWDDV